MFIIYRMLCLALKKVWMVKISTCQVPATQGGGGGGGGVPTTLYPPPPLPSKIPLCFNTILKTLIKLYCRGSSRLSQAVQAEVAEILNNINKVSSADLTMVGVRDHERLWDFRCYVDFLLLFLVLSGGQVKLFSDMF